MWYNELDVDSSWFLFLTLFTVLCIISKLSLDNQPFAGLNTIEKRKVLLIQV